MRTHKRRFVRVVGFVLLGCVFFASGFIFTQTNVTRGATTTYLLANYGASLAECRGTQTDNESLNSSWKVTGIATVDNPSDYLGGAVGNFTLYKKGLLGNWSENNSDEIRIWCDHKGVISTN